MVIPLGGIFRKGVLNGRLYGTLCDSSFSQSHLWGGGEVDAVLVVACFIGGDDAPEVVLVFHRVVFNQHQNGSDGFDTGGDVVIGQLAIDYGK